MGSGNSESSLLTNTYHVRERFSEFSRSCCGRLFALPLTDIYRRRLRHELWTPLSLSRCVDPKPSVIYRQVVLVLKFEQVSVPFWSLYPQEDCFSDAGK